VTVRLVGDDDEATGYYSPTYQTVINAGIPVILDSSSYREHNKFAIFDHEVVWTGSTNWTDTGVSYNSNNTIVITSTNMANVFSLEFEEMCGKNFTIQKWTTPRMC
jgi:phosphatidylserine/phosphatidylglycerophosphate/cardiolipin synthase-like enzyme